MYFYFLDMLKSKHVNFTLTVENDGRQSYTSGSTIRGTVILELLTDMTPINNISVIIQGLATVKFHIRCDGYSRPFTNSRGILAATQIVWDGRDHNQQFTHGLSAGVYRFPFAFLIPNSIPLPSSLEIDHKNSVQYSLFAGISQSTPSTFNHKTESKIIQVHEIININTPYLTVPLSATEQKLIRSFFRSSGSISFSVAIQRGGYCLGESIVISATAKNLSKKTIISLRANLSQDVVTSATIRYRPSLLSPTLTVPGSRHRLMVFNQKDYQATSVVGEVSYNWDNVLLPIPSQSLSPTSSSCGFIKVSYALNVTLIVYKEKDIIVKFPITIGTVPFRGQPVNHYTTNSGTPIIVSQTSYNVCPRPAHSHSAGSAGGGGACGVGGFGGGCGR